MEQVERTATYEDIEEYVVGIPLMVVRACRIKARRGDIEFPWPSDSAEAHIEALRRVHREGAAEYIEQVVSLLYELSE